MRIRFALLAAAALLMAVPAHANLITNGGFEAGNTGFTSGYTYVSDGNMNQSGCFPAQTYAIVTNANNCHSSWELVAPNSGSEMMVVNGSGDTSVAVWTSNSINVIAGDKYNFSAWAASIYPVSPADLDFKINGVSVGTLQLGSSTAWTQFSDVWTAGATGSVTLSIYDDNTDANGNDFALDDLSFTAVPEPMTLGLFGGGLLVAGWLGRKKKKQA